MPIFYCGPSGGIGGNLVDFDQIVRGQSATLNLDNTFVTRVEVWEVGFGTREHFIRAIRFTYRSRNTRETVQAHTGRIYIPSIPTDFELERTEIISAISGRYGRYVDSITIETMNVYTGQTSLHGRFGGGAVTSVMNTGFRWYRLPRKEQNGQIRQSTVCGAALEP